MRYFALATDYDGTIATHGQVFESTQAALARLKASGRKLLLVTGRELDELLTVYPGIGLFDLVVAENGALLYTPATRAEKLLGEPPPAHFVEELRARGVERISVGRSIVATWEPHEKTVLEVIRDLGLELQVIFNKGAVMILPSGVNKATGLKVALAELGLSRHNTVGVGDAENDHAFLNACECSAAVANALPSIKERVDYVCQIDHGAGVEELIAGMLEQDLADLAPRLHQRGVVVGERSDGNKVHLPPFRQFVLLTGHSTAQRESCAADLMKRFCECGYQFCAIDSDGSFAELDSAVTLGSLESPPTLSEVMELLAKPDENVVLNMAGVAEANRKAALAELWPPLRSLRAKTGRPHWLILDEPQHLSQAAADSADPRLRNLAGSTLLVAGTPAQIDASLLKHVDVLLDAGERPQTSIELVATAIGQQVPKVSDLRVSPGDLLAWLISAGREPELLRSRLSTAKPQAAVDRV